MAVYSWIYRKRKAFFLLLCVTTFWIAYLFLSLSSPEKARDSHPRHSGITLSKDAVSWKYFVSNRSRDSRGNSQRRQSAESAEARHHNKSASEAGGEGKAKVSADGSHDDGKLVLEPPQPVEEVDKAKSEKGPKADGQKTAQKHDLGAADEKKGSKVTPKGPVVTVSSAVGNASKNSTKTPTKHKEAGGFGKLVELGAKLRNKTLEVGLRVKNKTLSVLGIGDGVRDAPVSVLFHSNHWNLSVSFEDIGNIMKDTAFLNRRSPLDLHAPVLMSSQNRTANYTLKLKSHRGYCDCWDRHCVCCARLTHTRLHINNTICTNFTFLSKSQEFDLVVSVDSKPIDKTVIQAHTPPVLCIGSTPKVADICVRFFNMTFKVNALSEHKTQLLGCTDLSLNLYNKTLTLVPVDCFQIPGDANHRHADRPRFNDFPNWVP